MAMPSSIGIVSARRSRRMNHTAHTGPLPRSNGIAVAERVFPVLSKAWHVMLARRHCRRSQQEIKSWLWQVGHCLTS
jgi:hypothetical protein